jgi:hypothetical protein
VKELWAILIEKVKQIEPNAAALGIGIFGIFTIGMSTIVIVKFLNVLVEIVNGLGGKPLH